MTTPNTLKSDFPIADRPLARRTDLPQHERDISREAWDALNRGLESAREGKIRRIDLAELDSGCE